MRVLCVCGDAKKIEVVAGPVCELADLRAADAPSQRKSESSAPPPNLNLLLRQHC